MVASFETSQKIFKFIDSNNHDNSFGFNHDLHDDLDKYWMDSRVPSEICERMDNRLCCGFTDKHFSHSISEKISEQNSFRLTCREKILTSSRFQPIIVINRFLLLVLYVNQNSLCPHPRQNRKRSKHDLGTVKERRQVFTHSQRTVTLSLQKTRRRPRNVWSRTNGERI